MSTRTLARLAPLVMLVPGCTSEAAEGSQEVARKIEWVDVASEAGIDVVNVSGDPRRWYILESNGSGAAWLDYDRDGDVDLFIANGAELEYIDDGRRLEVQHTASCRLYRNDGEWRFTDVTAATGTDRSDWVNGVATGDIEGDGDLDLYLACFGSDVLLRNDDGRFVDVTAESGLGSELWGASATFGDPDHDGDLDLFVANYVEFDTENPPDGGRRHVIDGVEIGWGPEAENGQGFNPGAPNRFYRNDGNGRFTDATADSGLALAKALCSYACVFTDVDDDGWEDLVVANDIQPCNLFMNQGQGSFVEEGVARGFAFNGDGQPTSAMGLAIADVDRDGDLDVLRTNFDLEPNTLHLNDGNGRFTDRTAAAGLLDASVPVLGWGCAFLDAECDGDLDLLVANGHVMPQAAEVGMNDWAMPTQFFEATTRDGRTTWLDATSTAGAGLAPLRSARALAIADVDQDGDPDALVIDLDQAPRLLENRSVRRGRWITIALEGRDSNHFGFGARVTVRAGDTAWVREMRTSDGLYAAHEPRLCFGLGDIEAIDSIEVRWPSGRRSVRSDAPLDSLLTIREPEPIDR